MIVNFRRSASIAALACVALLGAACGGDDDDARTASEAEEAQAKSGEMERDMGDKDHDMGDMDKEGMHQAEATTGGAKAAAAGPRPTIYGHGAEASQATRVIEIKMSDDFRFDPGELHAKKGEVITFRVTNIGKLVHELTIGGENAQALHGLEMRSEEHSAEMGTGEMGSGEGHDPAHGAVDPAQLAELDKKAAAFLGVHVMPGETKELTWAFTGESPLIGCHIPGHWDAGMRGRVMVA